MDLYEQYKPYMWAQRVQRNQQEAVWFKILKIFPDFPLVPPTHHFSVAVGCHIFRKSLPAIFVKLRAPVERQSIFRGGRGSKKKRSNCNRKLQLTWADLVVYWTIWYRNTYWYTNVDIFKANDYPFLSIFIQRIEQEPRLIAYFLQRQKYEKQYNYWSARISRQYNVDLGKSG
jgi:hypothetical protein